MANKQKRRRTKAQGRTFKARIVRLRRKGKTISEIGQLVGVSKQYVSQVLIRAGLSGPIKGRRRARRDKHSREVEAAIARLREQDEYRLADWLQCMARRLTDTSNKR